MQDFETPVEMFDQRGAAFDPIAVVGVKNVANSADFGVVDMAADDAIESASAGHLGHRLLEIGDIADGVLHPVLEIG